MSQDTITRYICDNCSRQVFSAKFPTGWSSISFSGQTQSIFESSDICDSCASAFVSTMTKRKQIETGRHRERKLVLHNPPSPENARHSPFRVSPVEAERKVG